MSLSVSCVQTYHLDWGGLVWVDSNDLFSSLDAFAAQCGQHLNHPFTHCLSVSMQKPKDLVRN